MQHRLFAPLAFAAVLGAAGLVSPAFAADPSGIWAKDDGTAKMEVTKCGAGICSKIVWLQNPNDSRGQPLRDGRNENVSLRTRPIMGLPIFKLAPAGANVWVGPVYNPEEGKIYNDVKVTLVSSRQIVLRGCKAMLFCGEKTWTRTSLPPSARPEEPVEIEAKAPASEPSGTETAEAEAAPAPKKIEAGATQYIAPGVVATPAKADSLPLSGEDVPSMMVMNKPASAAAANAAAVEAAPPPPVRTPEAAEAAPAAPVKPKPPANVASRAAADQEIQAEAKPKAPAPVRQVQQEPRERLPWERPQGYVPSYLGFDGPPPPPRRGLFGGLFR